MRSPPDLVRPAWLEWFRRHIWVLAFAAGALTITAMRCSGRLRHVPDPPAVMFTLPDYALVDHRGEPFTPQTLRGKVWIAGFVFTSCPSSCPAVTKAMGDLRERLDRYGVDVEMVTFTVDPEHDTPQVLADYFAAQGVDSDKWRFVTGDPQRVLRLVRHGFKLGVGEREADESGVAYDIAHSTKLALVDADGGVRGFYGITDEHGTDEIFERSQHVLAQLERGR
ncbi:MAG: SCO family protein [Myxococcales bacterium]|nr:SCO family protein [Myxococcales bacterium]